MLKVQKHKTTAHKPELTSQRRCHQRAKKDSRKFPLFYLLLERGEGREKKRERNIDVREKHRSVASYTP